MGVGAGLVSEGVGVLAVLFLRAEDMAGVLESFLICCRFVALYLQLTFHPLR